MLNVLKQQKFLTVALLVFTLSIGILIGTVINTGVSAKDQQTAPDATPLVVPPVAKLQNEFTEIAKKSEPSVVFIRTDFTPKRTTASQRKRTPVPAPDEEEGDDQLDMFRRFFGGPQGRGGMPMPKRQGSGSGFVVDRNGYIITNRHVVDQADHIYVKFPNDDQEYKAKVIGTDKETDVAVIKIQGARPFTPVRIANSDGVQVGDWAIAIGAPFGLETSVTVGIVSAKGRDINSEMFQRFIQTDAAINPGNSGGPLLNRNGEVIGINTMIATESGGYQGIGFALPINMAVKVYNSVIKEGRVVRGSLGISFDKAVKSETLKALGLNNGVIVTDVRDGGPAQKAGIKKEDVLIAMNGKPFKDGDDLMARVADTPVGDSVKITADRDGKKMEFEVRIEDRMKVFKGDPRINPDGLAEETLPTSAATTTAKFGIQIGNLSDADREELKLDDKRGVRVSRVETDSFAEEIGMQNNDIIVSINRTPIYSIDDIKKVQGTLKAGDAVAFRVMRQFPTGAMDRSGRRATSWQGLYLSGKMPAGE